MSNLLPSDLSSIAEHVWIIVQRKFAATGNTITFTDTQGNYIPYTGAVMDVNLGTRALAAGAVTLSGNITFTGAQTVDGVDISAHAASASAHHNEASIGVGGLSAKLSMAAGQVLTLAAINHSDLSSIGADDHHAKAHVHLSDGSGTVAHSSLSGIGANDHHNTVTIGAGGLSAKLGLATQVLTLAAINHSDLSSVGANDHHNQAHTIAGADHTVTGSALDLVGLTGTNTLGVLTPSSDVSGGASAILRSNSGALTLKKLTVSGDDLVVGANILFVDYSQGNIGVNRAPDPQFDLDVNGNLRAGGWIVGKHAIQIPDALMICQYDGAEPYATDFTGETTGHRAQIATVYGGVVFCKGKFGKAVQTGAATTNNLKNPIFFNNVTDDWTFSQSGTGGSVTRDTSLYYIGQASAKILSGTDWSAIISGTGLVVANGESVTLSCRIWCGANPADNKSQVYIYDSTNSVQRAIVYSTISGGWEYLTCTWTNNLGSSATVVGVFKNNFNDSATSIWIGCAQLEKTLIATPLCHGGMGTGHTWSGTAHNSTSSRTATQIIYPALLPRTSFSIGGWFKPLTAENQSFAGGFANIFLQLGTYAGGPSLTVARWGTNTAIYALFKDINDAGWTASPTLPVMGYAADQAVFLCITFDGTTLTIHGAKEGGTFNTASSSSLGDGIGTGANLDLNVGGNPGLSFGGVLSDGVFVVSGRAMPTSEVRAIFESNAPVFAETSVWAWRNPASTIWLDAEGLWGMDAVGGNQIFGLSSITGKSWGGATLDAGDLMLGRVAAGVGNLLWDASAGALYLRSNTTNVITLDSSGASIAGVLSVGASGGIYQGTGTFASPTTGLKIWNDSGVGRIAGYSGGTLQSYFGTDGKLYAGAGNVLIDQYGITLADTAYTAATLFIGTPASATLSIGAISGHNYASTIGKKVWIGAGEDFGLYCRVSIAHLEGHRYVVDSGLGRTGNFVWQKQSGADPVDIMSLSQDGALVTTGGFTLKGHLIWTTDNTYDIGASGATRPRDIFLSRNATIGGGVNVGTATGAAGGAIKTSASIETSTQLISTVATGTAPLAVTSTTAVTNLNADKLDGNDASAFLAASAGADGSFDELTQLQWINNPDPPYQALLQYKKRAITVADGQITAIGAESGWTTVAGP